MSKNSKPAFPAPEKLHITSWRFPQAFSLAALLISGCAPMVTSSPALIEAIPSTGSAVDIKLNASIEIRLSGGYRRTLAAGSRWRPVGQLSQGRVYRPVNSIFTIEGRQVHEAYLVIDRDSALTGFFLPGEARFSPLDSKIQISQEVLP